MRGRQILQTAAIALVVVLGYNYAMARANGGRVAAVMR